MNRKIKVTIAVAIYYVDNMYLTECIESLINQTLEEIEILLISDCTSEENLELMKAYAKKDERIRIIENRVNRGLAGVRNQSIDEARGEYLCYVDNDDWLDLDVCRKAYEYGEKQNAEVVLWTYYTSLEGKNEKTNYRGPEKRMYVDDERQELQVQVLDPTYSSVQQIPMAVTVWAKLYSVAFLRENANIRFSEQLRTGGEDYLFNYRIMGQVNRAFFFEDYGYYYRQFPDSYTKKFRDDEWERRVSWMREIAPYVDSSSEKQVYLFQRFCLNQVIGQLAVTQCHPNSPMSRSDKKKELKKIVCEKEICVALKNLRHLKFNIKKYVYFLMLRMHMFSGVLYLSKKYNRSGIRNERKDKKQ